MSASDDVLSRPAPPPDHTARYGPHPEQVVDLRLPPGGAAGTLVVLVHGGFWRAAYDRAHTGPLADALARVGFAVAVPEYRRVGSPGGGWPGTFDDLAILTESLRTITVARGIRTKRTVLVGHSAGGHLALWAAARHRLPVGSPWRTEWRPDAVVSLAGCASLALADIWGLGRGATATLLGGNVDAVPDRYALADPGALLPLGVPVTLLHGSDDEEVPAAMSREYAALAERMGDPVRLVELPGMEHYGLIDPLSTAWPHLLDALGDAASTQGDASGR
ncbi:alpha/beta hydrolase family protein [Streptacidiphilus cavernicola]|uniref:Alpha/beta hydrolase family protein n=1 Tax=Streptacidiphilus cavernicola TaxID=3342716 RepID=A0ABV6VNR8_9ACTN